MNCVELLLLHLIMNRSVALTMNFLLCSALELGQLHAAIWKSAHGHVCSCAIRVACTNSYGVTRHVSYINVSLG